MKKVKFTSPNGQEMETDSRYIENLIMNHGAEFWEVGSGDASLRVFGATIGEVIFMVREHGVFLLYSDSENTEEWVLVD